MLGVSFVNEEADRYLMMHSMDGVIGFTVAKTEALHSGDPQSVKEAVTTQRNHTRQKQRLVRGLLPHPSQTSAVA